MFIHIFGFRWKPHATEADKDRAAQDIVAFRGHIPGLIDVHVGPNVSPRGQGYTFAGLMTFTDKAAATRTLSIPCILRLLAVAASAHRSGRAGFRSVDGNPTR